MKLADNQKRRALLIESREELRREFRREPSAREVLRRADQKDQQFARRWSLRQAEADRLRTARSILAQARPREPVRPLLREEALTGNVPETNGGGRLAGQVAAATDLRPSRRASPLWLVGSKQRNDLLPTESPVTDTYRGTYLPSLLNRGRSTAREIEARLGPTLSLRANDILPGDRGKFEKPDGGALYLYVKELFGGGFSFRDLEEVDGPVPELRYEFAMRYRYGSGQYRYLSGDLVGDRKRGFYRFEPHDSVATPLYG